MFMSILFVVFPLKTLVCTTESFIIGIISITIISNSCISARCKYLILLIEFRIQEFLATWCDMHFHFSLIGTVKIAKSSEQFHLRLSIHPPVFNPISYSPSIFPQPLSFLAVLRTSNSWVCLVLCSLLPLLHALFLRLSLPF